MCLQRVVNIRLIYEAKKLLPSFFFVMSRDGNSMKVQVVSGHSLFLETTWIGKVQVHI